MESFSVEIKYKFRVRQVLITCRHIGIWRRERGVIAEILLKLQIVMNTAVCLHMSSAYIYQGMYET